MERPSLWRAAACVFGLICASLLACGPTPVADPAASSLSVTITVVDTEDPPSDGKVPIVVQFFTGSTMVQLASTTGVSCNSVGMTWNGLGYGARVPLASPGTTYSCTHTRNGVNSTTTLTVPARPSILTPTNGASVARTSSMTITYVADGGTGMRAVASDGMTAQGGAHEPEPDNGTFTDLDTSGMQAGPGTLGIVRELSFAGSGSAFQSVTVKYSTGAHVNVTWT
jgi:hypothetical protein